MIKLNQTYKKLTAEALEHYALKQKNFPLKRLHEDPSFSNPLAYGEVNRPGLTLCGFFEYFVPERIQVFGRGEYAYIKKLCGEAQLSEIEKFLSYPIPCLLFSHGKKPPAAFIALCEQKRVPVFLCPLSTGDLIEKLHLFFEESYNINQVVNGVMLEVYGTGVLLQGEQGCGKSECALSLIEKGHRIIADDVVSINLIEKKGLVARNNNTLSHYMDIRGIGIVNIPHLFGVSSILKEKNLELIIELEYRRKSETYDLLSTEELQREILGIKVPLIKIPIERGSNIPLLVEVATMNERLKMSGYNATKQFNKRVLEQMARKTQAKSS